METTDRTQDSVEQLEDRAGFHRAAKVAARIGQAGNLIGFQ